ncbi:MAG: pantoate--beta-alanine ligase [Deltaproteobacteria bacterium]|nr:pantoate--beta-alanine ligase [Deltaproteobacteria bacterium]
MAKKPPQKVGKSAKPQVARPPKGSVPGLSAVDVRKGEELSRKLPGSGPPKVLESVPLTQAACLALRQRGVSVGFVPTMGALHEGHITLIQQARRLADVVVVSIFVNPTQFGPAEDFDNYPRDRDGDLMKCRSAGADLVFMPTAAAMYPDGFQTSVTPGPVAAGACGRYRPGHFGGVATIVLKLFQVCQPHIAVFGEKDWQQLAVVRRLVRDFNFPVEVVGVPTAREPDGLALSSRNRRLSPRDREQAPVLARAITRAQQAYAQGVVDAGALCRTVMDEVKTARGVKLQYVEIVDAESIQPLRSVDRPARVLVAAHLGNVRLIDNGALGG